MVDTEFHADAKGLHWDCAQTKNYSKLTEDHFGMQMQAVCFMPYLPQPLQWLFKLSGSASVSGTPSGKIAVGMSTPW